MVELEVFLSGYPAILLVIFGYAVGILITYMVMK